MKRTLTLLMALATGTVVTAQEAKSTYSVTTDFSFTSEYVFRGQKVADNSLQGSVEATFSDFYAGLWTSQPVTRHQNNEIDLYAGYKWKLNENLSFEGVGTYYWYPEAGSMELKHSEEVGVGATYSTRGITTSVYYYYDFKLETNTLQASVGYSVPLEAIGSSVDTTVYYGIVDGRDVAPWEPTNIRESYNYYGIDVNLPYKLSENATFTVGGHWAHNKNLPATIDDDHLWWTAGVTVGF